MAGGGKVRIADRDDFGELARVVNGRLLVSSSGGGGGGGDVNITEVGGVAIGATVPVSGTVAVVEPVSVDDNGGSLTVDGTVAVSSIVAPVNVRLQDGVSGVLQTVQNDGLGAGAGPGLALAGSVSRIPVFGSSLYDPGDAASLASDEDGSLLTNGVIRDWTTNANVLNIFGDGDAVSDAASYGIASMFEVGVPEAVLGDKTWNHAFITNAGRILVDATLSSTSITPGTGATNLGKAEDAVHASGDVGVMSLAVRNDALAALAANGDYIPLSTDARGALFVNIGDPSSLADGQLAAALAAIYTVPASTRVRVESIDLYNTSASLTQTVRIHLQQSGGTSRQVRQYTMGPGESISVLEGEVWNLEAGDEIEGFTSNASTVNYFITGISR